MTTRTITLTGRPPVKILDADWPVIAVASYHDWDGQYDFQAFRHWRGFVRVRQHDDGRVIVYAKCWYDTAYQERDYQQRAGELLEPGADIMDIVDAIYRVHSAINVVDEAHRDSWRLLAEECIANLPAEEL